MLRFIIGFLLLVLSGLSAQSALPDSIQTQLDTITNDTHRINTSNTLIRQYAFSDSALGAAIANNSIAFATETKDPFLLGKAYHEKAIFHLMRMEFKQAKPILKKAVTFFEEANAPGYLGYVYRNLGVSYSYQDQVDSSITAFYSALGVLDSSSKEDKLFYGITCEELAKVFYHSESLESSKKYAEQALKFYREVRDTAMVMNAYNLIALSTKNKDSALVYLDKIIAYSLENQDSVRLYNAYANYGFNLIDLNRLQEAKHYCKLSREWYRNKNQEYFGMMGINLANVYHFEDKIDSMAYYLIPALEIAKELDKDYMLEKAYNNMALLHAKRGEFEKSYEYSEKSKKLALQIRGERRKQEIRTLELELELGKKKEELQFTNREKDLLKEKTNLQQFFLVFSLIALMLVAVLSVLLWNAQKLTKKESLQLAQSNKVIQQQKLALEKLVENNKNLFAIIGHDLRGPISNISSALQLIPNENDRVSKDTKEIIQLAAGSAQDVWELLENLLVWSKNLYSEKLQIAERISIQEQVEKVIAFYRLNGLTKKVNLRTKEGLENLSILTNSNHFETILRNLISNAIKASKEGENITLSWKKEGEKGLLYVEDEAGGLPKKQQDLINNRSKEAVKELKENLPISEGLGLKLILFLLESSKGEMNYSTTKKGSLFTLSFPLAN